MLKKSLSIYVSTLPKMIEGNYIYVDKTRYIYHLFQGISHYYFLSRPRRFGKSLFVSTLKELFLGNKKLFEGLWISSSDYDWQEYPVIDLDFSRIAHGTVDELKLSLSWTLSQIAERYNVDISQAPTLSDKLVDLIQKLSRKNKVVVLVDEYDKPILDHIQNVEAAIAQRELLKSFYDPLKSMDAYLRAVFVTGVTKFSKTSLFSGMNNLNDISLDPKAAQLLGYAYQEIEDSFLPLINEISVELRKTPEWVMNKLQVWYNGYRFSKNEGKVYNPFSVLYALDKKEFLNYWYQSGTPTFLIHLIKNQYNSMREISKIGMSQDSLSNFELDKIPLVPLLFQAGYLTIADYDEETNKFKLGFPNSEVEFSFTKFLIETLTQAPDALLNTLGPN